MHQIFKNHYLKNWLLKLALLVSVFAFSGYNNAIHAIHADSDFLELVEIRVPNSNTCCNITLFNSVKQTTISAFLFGFVDCCYKYALTGLNQAIDIKYITNRKKIYTYGYTSIKFPFPTLYSSSDDENAFIL